MVGKILANSSETYGFNAQTEEYVDMLKAGIVDPAKVVRAAIQGAASVAGLLVTTEAMISEAPRKEARPCPPAAAWAAWAAWISNRPKQVRSALRHADRRIAGGRFGATRGGGSTGWIDRLDRPSVAIDRCRPRRAETGKLVPFAPGASSS